jgi:hypothetical protein
MASDYIDACCREAARVLKPSGYLLRWTDTFHLCEGDHLRIAELKCVDLIAWDNLRMGNGYRSRRRGDYLLVLQKPRLAVSRDVDSCARLGRQLGQIDLPGGPTQRALTTAFPQKGSMIVQRSRPPLLETPWQVFDNGVFTPNDQFFVRWHWAAIPEHVDVATFRLLVRGHVNTALSLSLADLLVMPRFERRTP